MYAPGKKRAYFCVACGKPYGSCSHTEDKSTLPKDERGITLSLAEYDVLIAADEI